MLRHVVVSCVLLVALGGCAALFHKPRPDLELALEERPWRVRCTWVLPALPGDDPTPRDDGWVWASDAPTRRLVVDGRIQDGFLAVAALRSASDEDDRIEVPLPATRQAVRESCTLSLDHAVEGAQPRLVSAMGVRAGEDIEVPLAFPDDPEQPQPISRVVVFGDSLSDSGNLKQRLLIFPNSPYWFGRFANGPNWTEYLADRVGLTVQNQAYGGAQAVKHEDVPTENVIAAIQQGAQFFLTGSVEKQVTDYLQRDLLTGTVQQPDATLFVIWGGANDYISKEPFTGDIGTLLDEPRGPAGYVRIVEEAVSSLESQVRRLYLGGARRFLLLNLPNLGKTPIVMQNESYFPFGEARPDPERRLQLSERLAQLTAHHNERLAGAHEALTKDLTDATIVYVDTAELVERILSSTAPDGAGVPFDYGFTLRDLEGELVAGRMRGRFQNRCYTGGYLGSLSASSICPEHASAMFWDVVHPTSYTHCWLAYFVQRALGEAGLAPPPLSLAEQRGYCTVRNQPAW